ncbi:hypothetical protein D3C72_2531470 [compost metagenome]
MEQSTAVDEQGITRLVQPGGFKSSVIQGVKGIDGTVMEQKLSPAVVGAIR